MISTTRWRTSFAVSGFQSGNPLSSLSSRESIMYSRPDAIYLYLAEHNLLSSDRRPTTRQRPKPSPFPAFDTIGLSHGEDGARVSRGYCRSWQADVPEGVGGRQRWEYQYPARRRTDTLHSHRHLQGHDAA